MSVILCYKRGQNAARKTRPGENLVYGWT
uniref:Uncharacterized protein n=1 Tax=Anguilla anguilla TaxID=7936 RepID=A0A0E9REI0_ANGAN